jgi:predicted DNA-binding transcriptional regulator YafY
MLETSGRLLRLLSLLQVRRDWPGQELADRLDVSKRTVRTDVQRLRALGYPIEATRGVSGGYRLVAGSAMPPLLLDDEEAVAVAVGLRTAAGGGVTGIEEASVSALAKLEQVLPTRLRHRVTGIHSTTLAVPAGGPTVGPEVLSVIATTVRASERLRFDYRDFEGNLSRREVEPHKLVSWGRRWYLVAWDPSRADWRTFRVDRMEPKSPNGARFTPRSLSEADTALLVQRGAGSAAWKFRARVRLEAPAQQVRASLPAAVAITTEGDDWCVVEVGSDSPHLLALYLGLLDVDFQVLDPPELVEAFARLAVRYARAAGSTG